MFFVAVEAEALIIVDSGKKISLGQTQVFKSRKALAVVNLLNLFEDLWFLIFYQKKQKPV